MAKRIRGKNEGSLHQRLNGTWRAQISLNGKRISKGFKVKADAQAWLRQMQTQLDRGLDYEASKITLMEYLPLWLENSTLALRPRTARQYGDVVRKHIIPYIGNSQLKDLRLAGIERFYNNLVQAGLGIRTIRITHSVLHRALEKAVRYGYIVHNPCHDAALPRYQHGEMKVLDEAEVNQLLVTAIGIPFEALYHLAVKTGMRQGELLGLRWSDLQWHSGHLYVHRQVQDARGGGYIFQEPKTRSGRRTIQLGEGTLDALRRHREIQRSQISRMGERWQDNDLIFTSKVGTPINPSNLRKDFAELLEKAGLKKIRFHDLRHTAASLMLNHGVPVIVVSRILGHSKPSITLDIYGHLYHEMQGEAARIMDELVTPIRVELKESVEEPSVRDLS